MSEPTSNRLSLTLLSHTNVGKTTLLRTLTGKDVGEVLDQAHVTDRATPHTLLSTPQGAELVLWDSPGFGDSMRLLRMLREHEDPLGWLESQSFDPHAERAMYCDREALLGVRGRADAVLYLVNASERPEDAGYVEAELELLTWVDRPVLLLLNQTGPPSSPELAADEERWRAATSRWKVVRDVLGLDAFTRCWVQEGQMFSAIEAMVEEPLRPLAADLLEAWKRQRHATFQESMELFAGELARAAADEEPVVEGAWGNDKPKARRSLEARMLEGNLRVVDRLIGLHNLEGRSELEFRAAEEDFKGQNEKLAPKRWGVVGGVVSGVLTGLTADIASGGMSLGGGMILGGLLGGLGSAGVASLYNTVRSGDQAVLRWTPEVLNRNAEHLLLRYLAISHFGRGRGTWRERDFSSEWRRAVSESVESRKTYFNGVWKDARGESSRDGLRELQRRLTPLLKGAAREVLTSFYPEAGGVL